MIINNFVETGVLKRSMGNLLVRFFAMPVGLLLSILLARALGAKDFGIYSFVVVLVFLFHKPLQSSISTLIIRSVASGYINKKESDSGHSVIFAIIVGAVFSFGCFWAFQFGKSYFPFETDDIKNIAAWKMALFIPFLYIIAVYGAFLRGMNKVTAGILTDQLVRPLFLLVALVVVFIFYGRSQLDAGIAINTYLCSLVACCFFTVVLYKTKAPLKISNLVFDKKIKNLFSSFMPLYFLGVIQALNSYMPTLFVGFFMEAEDVGLYKVADIIAANIGIGLLAVNVAIAPRIAKKGSNKDYHEVQKILISGARLILLLSTPIAAVCIFFPEFVVVTLFGKEYAEAKTLLQVLAIARILNTIGGPVGLTLNMLGYEKETVRVAFFSSLLNLIMCLLLIPAFGVVGACFSVMFAFVSSNGLLAWRLYKLKGLYVLPFGLRKKI